MKRQILKIVILFFFFCRISIKSRKNEASFSNTFQMFKRILPEGAFRNSENGSEVFSIDI